MFKVGHDSDVDISGVTHGRTLLGGRRALRVAAAGFVTARLSSSSRLATAGSVPADKGRGRASRVTPTSAPSTARVGSPLGPSARAHAAKGERKHGQGLRLRMDTIHSSLALFIRPSLLRV